MTNNTPAPTPASGFASLPIEIHCMISNQLSIQDNINLSRISRDTSAIYLSSLFQRWAFRFRREVNQIAASESERRTNVWTRRKKTRRSGDCERGYYYSESDSRGGYIKLSYMFLAQVDLSPHASVRRFADFVRIVGNTNYWFLSAAIHCLLRDPRTKSGMQSRTGSWRGPKHLPARKIPFLKLLLELVSVEGTRQTQHHGSAIRNHIDSTFMMLAIYSNNLAAVELVWSIFYQKDVRQLEFPVEKLLESTVMNKFADGEVAEILHYLLEEWSLSADVAIPYYISKFFRQNHRRQPRREVDRWGNEFETGRLLDLLVRPLQQLRKDNKFYLEFKNPAISGKLVRVLIRRGATIDGDANPFLSILLVSNLIEYGVEHTRLPHALLNPPPKPIPSDHPTGMHILEALLEEGVDPNIITDRYGVSLLHHPLLSNSGLPLFALIVRKIRPEFINLPSNMLETSHERFTPLQILLRTVRQQNLSQENTDALVPFVRVLLRAGADPNCVDPMTGIMGRSALKMAETDQPRMKRILREIQVVGKQMAEKALLSRTVLHHQCPESSDAADSSNTRRL